MSRADRIRRRIRAYRWRLARWAAPQPIMIDPCPGREAFVVQRSKPGAAQSFQMSVPLDSLDISFDYAPPKIDRFLREDELRLYNKGRRITIVTGRAES